MPLDHVSPSFRPIRVGLGRVIPAARLISDPLRRLAYGTDASFYRLIPELVVIVENEEEVRHVLAVAAEHRAPVTFRAAGTSLSGQAISDSILMVLGDGWRDATVSPDGGTIRLQPGVIGAAANRMLLRHRRKIGPDPASISTAKIGGIAANNASGMCCGTAQNSYNTLESMRLVLADGSVLNTGNALSRAAFAAKHRGLLDALRQMRENVRADAELSALIARKFAIKNTTGYALNALIDYADPIDILQHLMIGSEGTLGFISEIVLRTVPDEPCKASALLLFPHVAAAARAVALLKGRPVAAAELMDRASLRAVEGKAGIPPGIALLGEDAAALLVECRAETDEALTEQVAAIVAGLAGAEMLEPPCFDRDPAITDAYWNIRKGLFPAVGAARRPGTTVIIEDVAFLVEHLAGAITALRELFARHGYQEAIIFGHALAGNIHFVFTQDFDDPAEVERYRRFMEDVVSLVVVRFNGSLKAEHGTGRNMAPFVEVEWGQRGYELMQSIKQLLDPLRMLNPGVIFNDDPEAHVKNLKPLPAVDPLVDQCMECGFCEPSCPSHGFTLSPRQRIVGAREIARRRVSGEPVRTFERLFAFAGVDSCAACGLCANACPVGIETGALMKQERGQRQGNVARKLGLGLADHFATTLSAVRAGLGAADLAGRMLGRGTLPALSRGLHGLTAGRIPIMPDALPRPAHPLPTERASAATWLYAPSCAARAMGPTAGEKDQRALPDIVRLIASRAGIPLGSPYAGDSLCCGMPWESKGLRDIADDRADAMLDSFAASGAESILLDTSPCTFRLRCRAEATGRNLRLVDLVEFLHDVALPRLKPHPAVDSVMLHITCSSRRMRLENKLETVARACARQVVVPGEVGCCGFAGDKGFTLPELNDHALRHLPAAVPSGCAEGYSTSRTCEIGLSDHSGVPYRSLAYLVEKATRGHSS